MNLLNSESKIFRGTALALALGIAILGVLIYPVPTAYACYTWQVGQRVGLRGGAEIRHGPGFSYSVHTTLPADANDWPVDIIDGPRYADGHEWWDISRRNIDGGGTGWVSINQAGLNVCSPEPPPTSPGQIYVAAGLELRADPSGRWPPPEGDKLVGRFTLGNNGNQTIRLDGYGVRMRRNGTDYWDFLYPGSAKDLRPDETVRFDQNNERPLEPGLYRAEITWKIAGQDWEVCCAIGFEVGSVGGSYSISGRVIPGQPGTGTDVCKISEATVSACGCEIVSNQVPCSCTEDLVATTTTDSHGYYTLTELPAGTYAVWSSMINCHGFGGGKNTVPPNITGLDIRLQRHLVSTVRGRVVDQRGMPIEGVEIRGDTSDGYYSFGVTDSEGQYYFKFPVHYSPPITITPTRHPYTFSPPFRNATLPSDGTDLTGQDFVGALLATDRNRLVQKFSQLRDTVRSSIEADLDAFSELQAEYYVALRLDWKDYLQTVWTLASLTVVPDPAGLGRLGKDADTIAKFLKIVNVVDLGTDIGIGLASLLDNIPASATKQEIKNHIYSHFMNNVRLGSTTGVSGILAEVDSIYNTYVQQIPDPLPPDYPVDALINVMNQQIVTLNQSRQRETWVPIYTAHICTFGTFGVLQEQKRAMSLLVKQAGKAEDISFKMTVAEIGVFGVAGLLKVAGVVSVGGLIPSEIVLWGGAATIATVPRIIGATSSVVALSNKGMMSTVSLNAMAQLGNDLKMRKAVLEASGEWALRPRLESFRTHVDLTMAQILADVGGIEISDLEVKEHEVSGQGTAWVTLNNNGSLPINAVVFGYITAMTSEEQPIINLVGSSPTEILPGVQRTVEFPYTVFRSGLVDGSGYAVSLSVALSDNQGHVEIRGPFTSHFFVGTQEQLAILTDQQFTHIAHGNLEIDQVYSTSLQFLPTTQNGRLLLFFPDGADLDLHLYDESDRHVGLDYDSGQVENQIPGVMYSGPHANPEWIEVQNSGIGTYEVQVILRDVQTGTEYDLAVLQSPQLAAFLDAPPSMNWYVIRTDSEVTMTESFGVQISEGSGGSSISNVEITASDFAAGQVLRIPASYILCEAPPEILAGESVLATCVLTMSPQVQAGVYTGTLGFRGSDSQGTVLLATTQVTVTISTPIETSTFLPTILR